MPTYARLKEEPNADRIIAGLERLRVQLGGLLPTKTLESNLLLATWNIREFDSTSYGVRISDAMYFIAEIVSRFDIIAIQEVRRDLSALRSLVSMLGWSWRYLVTDTTEGDPGNDERLAFVYDSRKVRFGGLAGELVLPAIKVSRDGTTELAPVRQLARTPFTAAFTASWTRFQLATVHIVYGRDDPDDPDRVSEIQQLAQFFKERALEPEHWSQNLILLGDFNIYETGDATMKALTDAGWVVPEPLTSITGSNVPRNKHYDQIAVQPKSHWFEPTGKAGVIDYYESVFRDEDQQLYADDMGAAYSTTSHGDERTEESKHLYFHTYWRTYQMSDHLPMWIEIRSDYSQEYLEGLRSAPAVTPDPHI